jgi:hypothetical protein
MGRPDKGKNHPAGRNHGKAWNGVRFKTVVTEIGPLGSARCVCAGGQRTVAVVVSRSRVKPANGSWLVTGWSEPLICWTSSSTPARGVP